MSQPNDCDQMELLPKSSPADSHAKTSASPVSMPASRANEAGYGLNCGELLAKWDPDTQCWRTFQRCLLEGWAPLSQNWPRSGIAVNGTAYQLPPLVRLTKGTASGLLPTATTSDHKGRGAGSYHRHKGLDNHVKIWPTPKASPSGPDYARMNRPLSGGDDLATAIARCPTPSANDWKGSSKPGQRRGQLTDPAMGVIPASGQLSPMWVEWLMGFPIGWTDLSASETQ